MRRLTLEVDIGIVKLDGIINGKNIAELFDDIADLFRIVGVFIA